MFQMKASFFSPHRMAMAKGITETTTLQCFSLSFLLKKSLHHAMNSPVDTSRKALQVLVCLSTTISSLTGQNLYTIAYNECVSLVSTLSILANLRGCRYYTTRLWIGTPPQRFALIVDTGSTVTYVPCSTCEQCGNHQVSSLLNFLISTYVN